MTVQEAKEAIRPDGLEIGGKARRCAEFFEGLAIAEEALEKQINRDLALDLAWTYGQIDGSHHKMWVIDQMVRTLCGSEEEYKKWLAKYNDADYEWDCGIAP